MVQRNESLLRQMNLLILSQNPIYPMHINKHITFWEIDHRMNFYRFMSMQNFDEMKPDCIGIMSGQLDDNGVQYILFL